MTNNEQRAREALAGLCEWEKGSCNHAPHCSQCISHIAYTLDEAEARGALEDFLSREAEIQKRVDAAEARGREKARSDHVCDYETGKADGLEELDALITAIEDVQSEEESNLHHVGDPKPKYPWEKALNRALAALCRSPRPVVYYSLRPRDLKTAKRGDPTPADLLGALQDKVHKDLPGARAIQTAKRGEGEK
jgi:hypothetical protein